MSIHLLLAQVEKCLIHKQENFGVTPFPGRPPCILPNSAKERIIVDWTEQVLGFRLTTMMVYTYQLEEGL